MVILYYICHRITDIYHLKAWKAYFAMNITFITTNPFHFFCDLQYNNGKNLVEFSNFKGKNNKKEEIIVAKLAGFALTTHYLGTCFRFLVQNMQKKNKPPGGLLEDTIYIS